MEIITRYGERFQVDRESHMNNSTTQYPYIVPCYICYVDPLNKKMGYRRIPMEDVVEIIDTHCNHWVRKDD